MSTMNISLTADVARFVERELKTGRFASVSDLVDRSLRLLEIELMTEEEKLEELRAAVAEGIADMEAGRFSDRSVQDIADEVLQRDSGRAR